MPMMPQGRVEHDAGDHPEGHDHDADPDQQLLTLVFIPALAVEPVVAVRGDANDQVVDQAAQLPPLDRTVELEWLREFLAVGAELLEAAHHGPARLAGDTARGRHHY